MLTSALAAVAGRLALIVDGAPGSPPAATQIGIDGLAQGTCMSFPATGNATGKTVFVDPGHGGLDPGVVGVAGGQQVLEKAVALAVGTHLTSMLRADGYRVVMSRVADSSVARLTASDSVSGALTASAVHRDLLARIACANASGASALVSIHFNAFDDRSVGGTQTFYDAARAFGSQSKTLAGELQAALVAGLGSADRGVWTDDQLAAPALTPSGDVYGHLIELGPPSQGWVDDPSRMPGALVEPLFLTNAAEAHLAAGPAGQQRIAAAMRMGLVKYLSK